MFNINDKSSVIISGIMTGGKAPTTLLIHVALLKQVNKLIGNSITAV